MLGVCQHSVLTLARPWEVSPPRGLKFSEREAEGAKKGKSLVAVLGGRDNGDGETENIFEFFIRRLGENGVLADTDREIARRVHRLLIETAEIAHARDGDVDKFVEKTVHSFATESNHLADRLPLSNFERSDGLLRPARRRFLAGDFSQTIND